MQHRYLIFIGIIVIASFQFCQIKQKRDNSNFFHLNMSAGLTSLDPAFAKDQVTMWADNQLYNGLVQIDDDLNIIPSIAKYWNISNDGLIYTFYIRNDVYFHDDELFKNGKGRRVTAHDFVYSFNRIIDTTVASTGAWLFNGKVKNQQPFVALDDTTFVINLQQPFLPLLGMLTLQYCSVVPKEVVEHYGKDFRKHPVGTGPFKFVRWEENNVLILHKNEKYFETDSLGNKLPYIDGVRFDFITDKGIEFNQFKQGKIDFMTGLDISYKDELLTKNGELKAVWKDKINFIKMPYMNTEYIGISMGKQPIEALKNKNVRQAINYAINREKMIHYLRNGIGVPAESGMIPIGMAEYNAEKVKGYTYNVAKAKELLIEAGYPEGKGIEEITIFSNPTYQDLITNIANELKVIGINLKIENTPAAFLREAMRKNEVQLFRASWIGDYPDAENYVALFYSKYGAPPNYTFYKNEKYDRLYEQAISSTNSDVAREIYHQLEKMIIEDAPVIPLFYDQITRFTHKRVKNLPNNAMNLLILKNVKLEK
jgi:peptide/nickel transport system substrate-binding protein